MQCEIISIGDELLIGQVVNTNAAWLGRELTGLGLEIRQAVSISDDREDIIETLKHSMLRARWIFVTGGLGPTKDDRTKDALLAVFGGELVFHEPTWEQLGKIYALYGKELNDGHREQCLLPTSAQVLPNKMGTAPGLLFETSHCKICVMPGVPFEMEHIMQAQVIPIIKATSTGNSIIHRTLATVGEGESVLSAKIADIEDALPPYMHLAYLPAIGRVRIRINGRGADADAIAKEVDQVTANVASRISEFIYAEKDISLSEAIGEMLRKAGKKLAVAESCTGGYLSHMLTVIPNASDYFIGGAITYSNELKQSVLQVKPETLIVYGAVSEETAREMAAGAVQAFNANYAIAITGIAGPSGGTPEKPVGTVWIAVADQLSVVTKKYTFGKDRLRNIEQSAVVALDMLRKRL